MDDLKVWFDARSFIVGENFRSQSLAEGLRVARQSRHPDAVWFCSLFSADEDVGSLASSPRAAAALVLARGGGDVRAAGLAGVLCWQPQLVLEAAARGDEFALGAYATRVRGGEALLQEAHQR